MIAINLAAPARIDLARLEDFLYAQKDPLAGQLHLHVLSALRILAQQPGVGRPVGDGLRELIIDRGRGGYLARHQYQAAKNLVTVLRIRHQRESGYTDEEV